MKKIIILLLSFIMLCSFNKHNNDKPLTNDKIELVNTSKTYYNLHLLESGLPYQGFEYAFRGYRKLLKSGMIKNTDYLTICDFSQPDTNPRFYLINLKDTCIEIQTWVAHGKKSGNIYAKNFSNKVGSNKSSIGFFITQNTYFGKSGYSLRIKGIEQTNNNAEKRDVVIHGSYYVGANKKGRSLGCPALPIGVSSIIIDKIKEGSCVFIYYPLKTYANKSNILL